MNKDFVGLRTNNKLVFLASQDFPFGKAESNGLLSVPARDGYPLHTSYQMVFGHNSGNLNNAHACAYGIGEVCYPNAKDTPIYPDTWYTIEAYVVSSTCITCRNATVKWWVNGELNDNNRQWPSSGFCVKVEGSVEITNNDRSSLDRKLGIFRQQFPLLVANIQEKGYRKIIIQAPENGETGGTVLAQVFKSPRMIAIKGGFFEVLRNNSALKDLKFSLADIALLHELLHAFDEDNSLITKNLPIIGWNITQNALVDGFKTDELPTISNNWVTSANILQIKNELTPVFSKKGPWEVYLLARSQMKKFGYPTIYSVLGGPVESFAELGSYIALDPEATSYIKPETILWFQQNVLK